MTMGLRRERDSGFTAIELIISTVILGIITLPLLSAFVLGIGTSAESNQRTLNSTDAQLLSTYFASDVASSDSVSVSRPLTSTSNAPFTCGLTADVAVSFDWVASPAVHRYVAYVVQHNTDAEADLIGGGSVYKMSRVYCENNSGSGPVVTSYDLANTLTAEPQLKCDGALCPTGDAPSGISPAPSSVSLTITEYGRKASDPTTSYTLQGTRRVTTS